MNLIFERFEITVGIVLLDCVEPCIDQLLLIRAAPGRFY
jgi:hypothetical protein